MLDSLGVRASTELPPYHLNSLVLALGSGESMLSPMPYQVKAKEGELQISMPEKVKRKIVVDPTQCWT